MKVDNFQLSVFITKDFITTEIITGNEIIGMNTFPTTLEIRKKNISKSCHRNESEQNALIKVTFLDLLKETVRKKLHNKTILKNFLKEIFLESLLSNYSFSDVNFSPKVIIVINEQLNSEEIKYLIELLKRININCNYFKNIISNFTYIDGYLKLNKFTKRKALTYSNKSSIKNLDINNKEEFSISRSKQRSSSKHKSSKNLIQKKESRDISDDFKVKISALYKKRYKAGEFSEINFFLYENQEDFNSYKEFFGDKFKTSFPRPFKISEYGEVTIRLHTSVKDIVIDQPEISADWEDDYLEFNFLIKIPETIMEPTIPFTADVFFNNKRKVQLSFKVTVDENQNIPLNQKRIINSFLSYASEDYSEVIRIKQGLEAGCDNLDVFMDKEGLKEGKDWPESLEKEIMSCDIFYLCWSPNAQKSPWVEREWQYAFFKRGEEIIHPIGLKSASECPLPDLLKNKQSGNMHTEIISLREQLEEEKNKNKFISNN